jgi:hypothetical protein
MAMLFDPATHAPTHTVVEAQVGGGHYMVADPAFNLVFPRSDGPEYHDLLDLRNDPSILTQRLDVLTATPDSPPALHAYRHDRCVYDHASSINWDKTWATRLAFAALQPILGEEVHRVQRPVFFEEPKLAVALAALITAPVLALIPTAVGFLCSAFVRRYAKTDPSRVRSPEPYFVASSQSKMST